MKRTFAAAIAAMTASTSIWLAAGAGAAAPAAAARPEPLRAPIATLRVVPKWTYQGSGRLAVIAECSQRGDVRVIASNLLRRPVTMRKGKNLLIKVTRKTKPRKYTIMLVCEGKHAQPDSADMRSVRIYKVLSGFQQPDQPALPAHFKPDVTVSSGPPAPAHHTKHHKKKKKRH